jgi:hypothetical protein
MSILPPQPPFFIFNSTQQNIYKNTVFRNGPNITVQQMQCTDGVIILVYGF